MSAQPYLTNPIDEYFDAASFRFVKRKNDRLLGFECETAQGVRIFISFEGRQARQLKAALDRKFAADPGISAWS